jgi:hypothetical protein
MRGYGVGPPVVAVKEGGVRQSVMHSKTGVLTQRNEHMFAKAVMELLSNEEKMRDLSQKRDRMH